jgi:hypothetical protein
MYEKEMGGDSDEEKEKKMSTHMYIHVVFC